MTLSEIYAVCEDYLGRKLREDEKDWLYIRKLTGAWGFRGSFSLGPAYHKAINRIGDSVNLMSPANLPPGTHGHFKPGCQYTAKLSNDGKWLGDWRYVARAGNPIDWQLMREVDANRCIGILFVPEHKDKEGRNYCAQFRGAGIYKIWMRLDQAEACVKKMVANWSLLRAVEVSLDIPLTPIEKDIIRKVMRN